MAERRGQRIPEATVARLPLYQRILVQMAESRTPTVSSESLGALAGVNAAKVRKDLSYLGTYGVRGAGYEVERLLGEIGRELGMDKQWPLAIVGMGNLGTALANSRGFSSNGFRVAALFDVDRSKVGSMVGGVRISPVADLEQVVAERGTSIAVIATPPAPAQALADRLVAAGAGSILNFAPAVLNVPESVQLRSVDLSTQLQVLSFYQSHPAAAPVSAHEGGAPAGGESGSSGAAAAAEAVGTG